MMVIQALLLSNEIPWKTAFAKYWTSESLTASNFIEAWLPLSAYNTFDEILSRDPPWGQNVTYKIFPESE